MKHGTARQGWAWQGDQRKGKDFSADWHGDAMRCMAWQCKQRQGF